MIISLLIPWCRTDKTNPHAVHYRSHVLQEIAVQRLLVHNDQEEIITIGI